MITSLINRNKVNNVFRTCPYYDDIVNYEDTTNNPFSINLIDWYKDLIFDSDTQSEILSQIDKCLYLYTMDNKYQTKLKRILPSELTLQNSDKIIDSIINCYQNYEEEKIYHFINSRWL